LGTAASFVGLAGSTFTNTGSGVYYGNVGVSPGTEVVGFPPGEVRQGAIYGGGAVPEQAQVDATSAYNALALQSCDVNLTDQDLGGMTLSPGVYCFNTSAQLTGDLVLDALGDPNAVWVFQTGSTLTTASGSSVRMINGGQALNVFWQVGSSATLGTTTRFIGNILADQSITLVAGAGLFGRALALHGAVTMDTNGSPPIAFDPVSDLSIVKSVDQANAVPGQPITYTLTFFNVGNVQATGVTITDTIPISVTGTSVISSGVAITPVNGTRYVWDIAPLAAGQGGVITITGQLSATLPAGIFTNTAVITTSAQDSDGSNNSSSVGVNVAPPVTLTINIVGRGSVTREPPGSGSLPYYIFPFGIVVTLTATPDAGWYFSGWSGDLGGAANPAQVTMDADKTITATFECRIYLPLVQKNN
jgi:uncharacterized repeat protein (TIGR01451 family)